MMKLGYSNTIPEEGELKPLTNDKIPETGGSRVTKKKHQVILFALALVTTIVLLMGHLANNNTDDITSIDEMNNKWSEAAEPEFMVEQSLVDYNRNCRTVWQDCVRSSDCCSLEEKAKQDLCCGARPGDGRYVCLDRSIGGGRSKGWYCNKDCMPKDTICKYDRKCCSGSCTGSVDVHYCA